MVKLITLFSSQHLEVRDIFASHWYLLHQDPVLRKHIGLRPELTFRRANSLCDRLVSSHYFSNPISTNKIRASTNVWWLQLLPMGLSLGNFYSSQWGSIHPKILCRLWYTGHCLLDAL